ncbi:MAG: glycine-rich domain-containing protein, partial [Kiritimatiellia bacterium]
MAATSGGTVWSYIQNGTNYVVHTFTTVGSNSFNVTSGGNVEVLVVGGGGGGGGKSSLGGGGGGGGVTNNPAFAVVGGSNYTVTVGAGGLGALRVPNYTDTRDATSGSNSVFGSIIALGGGNGAGGGQAAGSGNRVVGSG